RLRPRSSPRGAMLRCLCASLRRGPAPPPARSSTTSATSAACSSPSCASTGCESSRVSSFWKPTRYRRHECIVADAFESLAVQGPAMADAWREQYALLAKLIAGQLPYDSETRARHLLAFTAGLRTDVLLGLVTAGDALASLHSLIEIAVSPGAAQASVGAWPRGLRFGSVSSRGSRATSSASARLPARLTRATSRTLPPARASAPTSWCPSSRKWLSPQGA